MIARCSACRAVASDLAERLEPFQSKSPSEIQMMEVIEGPDDLGHNLGHICMAMKVRWHYLTIMDGVDRFSEAEIKAFAKRAGEPLAKWVPTTEEETWPQEKKELLANRRKLAEYCTTLVERAEDTVSEPLAKLEWVAKKCTVSLNVAQLSPSSRCVARLCQN